MSTGLFADEEDGYNLEEEVKYKLKVGTPSAPPSSVPTEPDLSDDLDLPLEDADEPSGDKPFDDTPFDAGVEADEDEDPEKFIQQLAGKLGTTLRKYTEDKGEPDFPLEKFAINSVISATHTAEMDKDDQKDIIDKIKSSGAKSDDIDVDVNVNTKASNDEDEEEVDTDETKDNVEDEEPLEEIAFGEKDPYFEAANDRQVFEIEDLLSDDVSVNGSRITEEDSETTQELQNEMFFNDVYSMYASVCELLELEDGIVDELLSNGHGWALDHISTANAQLESVYHYLNGKGKDLSERETNNYMFFQNLKNIKYTTFKILDMDVYSVDNMLCEDNWMLNLVARANDDVEEVYHFIMGELDEYDYEEWSKPMELEKNVPVSDELGYHLSNGIALGESVFRYGSDKFFKLIKEVKSLHSKGLIKLNENDAFIVKDLTNEYLKVGENKIKMDFIFENLMESSIPQLEKEYEKLNKKYKSLDKKMDELARENKDTSSIEDELEKIQTKMSEIANELEKGIVNEAEYKGKEVELNKPKRGGSKKFYVYVKDPKSGKVKKVSFGAKDGGGKLAVKLKDPKARKRFADRHNCEQKNDKTKPGYWSCRLPRFSKLLGISGGGRWW